MVKLRRASEEDAARLYAWRLDPVTAAASVSDPPKTFEAHCAWLNALLDNQEVGIDLYVAHNTTAGFTVGMVRLDFSTDDEAEVSISVDAQRRGHGYAAQMLEAIMETKQASKLVAHIKENNYASLRLFWAAGFRGTTVKDGLLRLERIWS